MAVVGLAEIWRVCAFVFSFRQVGKREYRETFMPKFESNLYNRLAMFDYLIVGSGLYGATFAYFAHRAGKKCLVIEKRGHAGGNVFTENVCGINVHKYGAHIFHTSDERIWSFVNSLVPFNRYTNTPVASYKGRIYNLPFNMNTFYGMWGVCTPEDAALKIDEQCREARLEMEQRGHAEPENLEEQALCLVGKDIYEALIKGYTEKQWGRSCTELPAFIIKRLPLRFVFDNNYFNDAYQGIPIGGYNKLIAHLLNGIEVRLNTDFFDAPSYWKDIAHKVVYTGPLDQYFGYKLGKLSYRTVRFEETLLPTANFQGNAVVNYTDAIVPYTRIIEHTHLETFGDAIYANPHTVISREYSCEWKEGMEPYYPVNDERNNSLAARYMKMATQERGVIFGGRLAEYKYYDMAPVIGLAMQAIEKEGIL